MIALIQRKSFGNFHCFASQIYCSSMCGVTVDTGGIFVNTCTSLNVHLNLVLLKPFCISPPFGTQPQVLGVQPTTLCSEAEQHSRWDTAASKRNFSAYKESCFQFGFEIHSLVRFIPLVMCTVTVSTRCSCSQTRQVRPFPCCCCLFVVAHFHECCQSCRHVTAVRWGKPK